MAAKTAQTTKTSKIANTAKITKTSNTIKTVPYTSAVFSIEKCDNVSIVLINGEDEGAAKKWVEEILNTYIPKEVQSFNYAKIDPRNFPVNELMILLEELPMMAKKRIILASKPWQWNPSDQQKLAKNILDNKIYNLIILWMVSETKELDKKLLEAVKKNGIIFTAALKKEKDIPVFQLLDGIGTKDAAKCCKLLAVLWEEKIEPLQILSIIAGHLRLMLAVKGLGSNLNSKQVADTLKIHPYRASKIISQSKQFALNELILGLELLLKTDASIKTGQVDPRHGIEILVILLCRDRLYATSKI